MHEDTCVYTAKEVEELMDTIVRLEAEVVQLNEMITAQAFTSHAKDKVFDELAETLDERNARIDALHRALTDLLFWSTPGEERGCACDRCRAIRKARAVAVER